MRLNQMPAMLANRKNKSRICECGCTGHTRGGRFIPGHDSRLNGWAIRIARGYSTEGITMGERTAAERVIKSNPAKFHVIGQTDKLEKVS